MPTSRSAGDRPARVVFRKNCVGAAAELEYRTTRRRTLDNVASRDETTSTASTEPCGRTPPARRTSVSQSVVTGCSSVSLIATLGPCVSPFQGFQDSARQGIHSNRDVPAVSGRRSLLIGLWRNARALGAMRMLCIGVVTLGAAVLATVPAGAATWTAPRAAAPLPARQLVEPRHQRARRSTPSRRRIHRLHRQRRRARCIRTSAATSRRAASTIYGIPYVVVDGTQPKKSVDFDYSDESDGVNHTTDRAAVLPDPGRGHHAAALDRGRRRRATWTCARAATGTC